MLYYEFKENEIMKVDLHRMRVWEAAMYLNEAVNNAPENIKEIIVIHGYHNGTSLLDMVRKDFINKRVGKKLLGINQGITSLILN
ncbi:Smr/MutS family protein [Clostridium sulfidigenes]|nr:Smr/MutS family protein [Clostridium sulfidigenes]